MKRTGLVIMLCIGLTTTPIALASCGGAAPSSSPSPDQGTISQEAIDALLSDGGFTDRENNYLDAIGRDSADIGKALDTLGNLSPKWPLWSDSEQIRIGGALAMFTVANQKWKHRRAPSKRFHHLRTLWVNCLSAFDRSGILYARGVDTMDANVLLKANKLMGHGAALAKKSRAEIDWLRLIYDY